MLGAVLAAVAALTVAVLIALGTGTRSSGNGCVHVNLPYATGGSDLYACGARARAVCGSIGRPGGVAGVAAGAVSAQCRKAGIAVPGSGRAG